MRKMLLVLAVCVSVVAGANPAAAQQPPVPAFCSSGAGHPLHGRSWCVRHGYTLGRAMVWNQVRWEDAVLRPVRRDRPVSRSILSDVLGEVVLRRLEEQRRRLDAQTPLSGRWRPAEGSGELLQVFSGRTPVAELLDWDGNGRIDLVLLYDGLVQEQPRRAR
jgi:hypothetical protein